MIAVERPSTVASSLLFAPLIAAATLLPLLASPTTNHGRVVTLLLGGGWLVYAAVSGLRPTRLDIPVSSSAVLVLKQSRDGLDSSYRVVVEDGARSELVLDHEDPARALRDLRRIAGELQLEVRPGWGLAAEDIALAEQLTPARLEPVDVRGRRWQAQDRAALAAFAGSLFIVGITLFTYSRVSAPVSTLGHVLPIVFALLIGAASLLLWTLRMRVRVTEQGLRLDTVLFHWSLEEGQILAQDILGARAVAAGAHGPQHVLVQTTSGPRSIPLAGPGATEVARAITRAAPEPKDPRLEWARPARGHAVSLEENPC
jgi:hypothetical protein